MVTPRPHSGYRTAKCRMTAFDPKRTFVSGAPPATMASVRGNRAAGPKSAYQGTMRNLAFAVALVVSAFAAGLAGSWIGNRSIEKRLDDQLEFVLTREPEARNRLSLYTLQALQAGDTKRAVQLNCQMLRSSLPLMRMANLDTQTQAKVMRDLIEQSQSVVSSLEGSGACGPKRDSP